LDDKDSGNKKNDLYDGVIYESTRNITNRDSARPGKKKQSKNNMATFYIITLVIAILLCMIIFAVVFQLLLKPKPSSPAPPVAAASPAESIVTPVGDLTGCSGVIKMIDPAGGWMDILDVSTNAAYHLIILDNTIFQDKSGAPLLIGEFSVGEIVDAKYDPQTSETDLISKKATAWTIRERGNIRVDPAAKTITVDNDVYSYNDNLVTMYNGKPFTMDLLQPIDILTVTGVGQTAWSVTLIKGHGSLYISNADNITNGVLEIDNNIYQQLGGSDPIYLTEGSHHVVIRGDNIETCIQDIVIEANKTQYVNLGDLIKLKTGWLNIQVNVQDYRLFVDNEAKTPDQPVNLTYGSHVIRVEKDGYVTSEQTIDFHDLANTIKVNLNPLLRLGKIIVTSDPSGAQVYVDSAYIGDTPVSVSIELGPHTLVVSMDGYNSIMYPINVDRDSEPFNPYNFELLPEQPQVTPEPFIPSPPPQATDTPFPTPEPPQVTEPPGNVFNPPEEQTATPTITVIPTPAKPGYRHTSIFPGIWNLWNQGNQGNQGNAASNGNKRNNGGNRRP